MIIPAHERGYHIVYRDNQSNVCPGCGRQSWLIGRVMAECGFCATALPLQDGHFGGGTVRGRRGLADFEEMAA